MLTQLPDAFGGYPVTRKWLPKAPPAAAGKPPARPGRRVEQVSHIVIGDTGFRGLTIEDALKNLGQLFGHFIIDDRTIVELVPALTSGVGIVEEATFVTSKPKQKFDPQTTAIAVNLCFGGSVKANETYDRCAAVAAFACERFRLSPADALAPASALDDTRDDPAQPLKAASRDFDQLKQDVLNMLKRSERHGGGGNT
jgi:hypothetical protein